MDFADFILFFSRCFDFALLRLEPPLTALDLALLDTPGIGIGIDMSSWCAEESTMYIDIECDEESTMYIDIECDEESTMYIDIDVSSWCDEESTVDIDMWPWFANARRPRFPVLSMSHIELSRGARSSGVWSTWSTLRRRCRFSLAFEGAPITQSAINANFTCFMVLLSKKTLCMVTRNERQNMTLVLDCEALPLFQTTMEAIKKGKVAKTL